MDGARARRSPRPRRLRRFAPGLALVAAPWLSQGCAPLQRAEPAPFGPRAVQIGRPVAKPAVAARPAEPADVVPVGHAEPAEEAKPVPVSLDSVLRLAEEQNGQIAVARERVNEAYLQKDVAELAWLPAVNVGVSYFRHEGGIQDLDGRLLRNSFGNLFPGLDVLGRLDLREITFARLNAERQIWQQKGELTRVNSETLLEASSTYIDLLTARTASVIVEEQVRPTEKLLERAEKVEDPVGKLQIEALRGELQNRRQTLAKLKQQGDAAAAKLAYLLGVGPCALMVPTDPRLVPLHLIDATPPCCELVAMAMAGGPGLYEMEQLLSLLHQGLEQANGPGRWLPIFEMRMQEGALGAGPNSTLDWANRWDLGLQMRWNLSDYLIQRRQQRVAASKVQQVHLTYDDLRAKLSLGVQEAREAILSGQEQMKLAENQIRHAREGYRLSDERLNENLAGSSTLEVLGALRSAELAQLNYLTTVAAYNKAQLRLMILLGPKACQPPAPVVDGPAPQATAAPAQAAGRVTLTPKEPASEAQVMPEVIVRKKGS